jgi:pimeloyl-ACP methyl ester carboxylesterase
LGDGTVPVDVARNIAIPTLVIYGEKSFDFMAATADTISKIIHGAVVKSLKDQTHDVSPESAAEVLLEFFGM